MLRFAIILAAVAVYLVRAESKYLLYTKDNIYRGQTMDYQDGDLAESTLFKENYPTVILVHGHGGSSEAVFNRLITEAILNRENDNNYNVIVVDWNKEASYSYAMASAHVPDLAKDLVAFIAWLVKETKINHNSIHLVGFGLGAHAVGITGRSLTPLPARITGLDPSKSLWTNNNDALNRNDASYVEVIHTDGSGLLANGIGTAIGDINFYANGGSNQPGCLSHSCSHDRAYELFAASMINPNLIGNECTSQSQVNLNRCRGNPLGMGNLRPSKNGGRLFRVNTGRRYPFN